MNSTIVWTKIDEAPALATYSFLPIVRGFLAGTGVDVVESDISLAGRIAALFPERLTEAQRVPDNLAALGELTLAPEANIIKLPNISATVPQLKKAITELQAKGYDLPDYPEEPTDAVQREVQTRYAKVLGSAVNPVLRQGNSDRRAPLSVKNFAKKHPHKLGAWAPDNKARVVSMPDGDFFAHERSVTREAESPFTIEFTDTTGATTVLAASTAAPREIVDATFLSVAALRAFYAASIDEAEREGLLLSAHLKATMMKVSDPVMFGHAVEVFFGDVFAEHGETFARLGVNPNLGLGDLYAKIATLPASERAQIEAAMVAQYRRRPPLAMVDSAKGITNLHTPSGVIIDASMPVVVRDSGQMWNPGGELQQTLAMVPDRSYGPIYAAVFDDCREHGAYDPATMGDVPNVGLMAQKAEEYGSHPTTFIMAAPGRVEVKGADGDVWLAHAVEAGDIWRMSRAKDVPIRDWVRLAVTRARATGAPAVFWLDEARAHDRLLRARVREYLAEHDLSGLVLEIMSPVDAMRYTLERIRRGEDTISVTGNVLRDYLTDLFPILEIGTSAKMLSVVPLLAGGGLFETGAGGSAPKHVQQFVEEGYLRWDSLGEFSALGASLEHVAATTGNTRAQVLAVTLDRAIGTFLDENKSPARKVGQIDNRGSHFYLALYWAQELAAQAVDAALAARFAPVAGALRDQAATIEAELIAAQGEPVDLGGYYLPDDALAAAAMRPSPTLNAIIDGLGA